MGCVINKQQSNLIPQFCQDNRSQDIQFGFTFVMCIMHFDIPAGWFVFIGTGIGVNESVVTGIGHWGETAWDKSTR